MKHTKRFTVVALACLMVMVIAGCGSKTTVVGTWSTQNEATTIQSLVLNEDGSGVMDLGDGITVNMNYETSGDTITISTTYLGTTETTEYTYTLKKDTLTLTKDGESIELSK